MDRELRNKANDMLSRLRRRLLDEYDPARPWVGRLSSSAVATATAVGALWQVDAAAHAAMIGTGLDWLARTINDDGGWGDSPESPSNLSATLLVWSALAADEAGAHATAVARCEGWLTAHLGGTSAQDIRAGINARYGSDRTFACPILTMCALSGRLGSGEPAWEHVPALPFELARMPQRLFKWLDLTVVSYALPALIAMGIARHERLPTRFGPLRRLRDASREPLLAMAAAMQPSNGGYEEATPLTAFVTMALAASGYRDNEVVRRGVEFLVASARDDGSWPIDTDLATWLTVHAVGAMESGTDDGVWSAEDSHAVREWLLAQQHTAEHPLTFGAPGGWAWSDLPGAMPDADDTAGVLLALRGPGNVDERVRRAAADGVGWLLDLQNRDGGIPTFSRGWGKLPFDRSCPDITAHSLLACMAWQDELPRPLRERSARSMQRMTRYLERSQTADGAWLPLWFGTQVTPDEKNMAYGTARSLVSLRKTLPGAEPLPAPGRRGGTGSVPIPNSLRGRSAPEIDGVVDMISRGTEWLLRSQNGDGGWGAQPGTPSTIEETALALQALCGSDHGSAIERGVEWLVRHTDCGRNMPAAPIGLYFARLWYSEELYPVVFAAGALGKVLEEGSAPVP